MRIKVFNYNFSFQLFLVGLTYEFPNKQMKKYSRNGL